jgi:SagB-type dehydrogenase family enzyme
VKIGQRFQGETSYAAPEGLSLPSLQPAAPGTEPVRLPRPAGDGPGLWGLLGSRRSRRDYTGQELGAEELGALLWAAQGLTATARGHGLRAAPSAGGLYPLDLYAALPGGRCQPGIYRYEPEGHLLRLRLQGPALAPLASAALDQEFVARSAVTLVMTAHPERSVWRYEERAWRYFYLDAGGIGENILLAAEALGLGACAVGAFYDSAVNGFLGLDGEGEIAVYMVAVGRRAAEPPGRGA